jgi:hypothetical protein
MNSTAPVSRGFTSCNCKSYCIEKKCKCLSINIKCNSTYHSNSSCKNKLCRCSLLCLHYMYFSSIHYWTCKLFISWNLLPQFGRTYLTSCRGCWRKLPRRVLEIKIWPERIAVVFSTSHEANFASWQFFTCQNALWLLQNVHDAKFRDVAVSLLPQRFLVVFFAHYSLLHFERNIYTKTKDEVNTYKRWKPFWNVGRVLINQILAERN